MVASNRAVGLEADLTAEGGLNFTLVARRSGEQRPAELRLDEELGIERARGGVEGRSGDRRVDEIGSSDSVAVVQWGELLWYV